MTDASPTLQDLLHRAPPAAALDWAARSVGSHARLLSIEPLTGGQSHANHALRVLDAAGNVHEVVLRRWVRPDWRETDPRFSPEQEAATLDLLASSAVPAPHLVAADAAGRACDVPALLLTRSHGERPSLPADMASFVRQLAAALPAIHGIDRERARRTVPPYRPYFQHAQPRPPVQARTPALWERAIDIATTDGPGGPACFIHRDYHPGNTLWVSDRLNAIVDWTSASYGSPSVDVSHMRVNLVIEFDRRTADAFLAAHREIVGSSAVWNPFWDLRVAVDLLSDLPPAVLESPALARLEGLVSAALALIG